MNTLSNDRPVVPEHEARERLWSLVKDIRFAMFTVRHPASGHLHSRPMTTQNSRLDEDSSLWFFMSRRGEPVQELMADGQVNVAYADPSADRYVSVSGTAAVVVPALVPVLVLSPVPVSGIVVPSPLLLLVPVPVAVAVAPAADQALRVAEGGLAVAAVGAGHDRHVLTGRQPRVAGGR